MDFAHASTMRNLTKCRKSRRSCKDTSRLGSPSLPRDQTIHLSRHLLRRLSLLLRTIRLPHSRRLCNIGLRRQLGVSRAAQINIYYEPQSPPLDRQALWISFIGPIHLVSGIPVDQNRRAYHILLFAHHLDILCNKSRLVVQLASSIRATLTRWAT